MQTSIHFALPPGRLRVGLIEANGLTVKPSSPAYLQEVNRDIGSRLDPDYVYPDYLRKGIRSLLKSYGFHASGRNRPASEYLVKDLQGRGSFHAINNVVDINNHLSLVSHLPISILDLDKTGNALCLRLGRRDEHYLFNQEGQDLQLGNLIVVAHADGDGPAFGSPIKDSHATKISPGTVNALGIIYSSDTISETRALDDLLARFADLLRREANAAQVTWDVIDSL